MQSRPSSPLVRCQAVSKFFGGVKALDGVTLDLHAGEVVAAQERIEVAEGHLTAVLIDENTAIDFVYIEVSRSKIGCCGSFQKCISLVDPLHLQIRCLPQSLR